MTDAAQAQREQRLQWAQGHPPRHARYLVRRQGRTFVATPCYGMHMPWWVPMTHDRELDPIDMAAGDQWIPLAALDAPEGT